MPSRPSRKLLQGLLQLAGGGPAARGRRGRRLRAARPPAESRRRASRTAWARFSEGWAESVGMCTRIVAEGELVVARARSPRARRPGSPGPRGRASPALDREPPRRPGRRARAPPGVPTTRVLSRLASTRLRRARGPVEHVPGAIGQGSRLRPRPRSGGGADQDQASQAHVLHGPAGRRHVGGARGPDEHDVDARRIRGAA